MFNFNNVTVVSNNNFRTTFSVVCDVNFVPVLNEAGYPIIVQTYNVNKAGKSWGTSVEMGQKDIQFSSIGAVRAAAKSAADRGVDMKTAQEQYLAELEAAKAAKAADKKSESPNIHVWMEFLESLEIPKGKNSTNWLNPGFIREKISEIVGAQVADGDFKVIQQIKEIGFSTERFVEQYREYKNTTKKSGHPKDESKADEALTMLQNL